MLSEEEIAAILRQSIRAGCYPADEFDPEQPYIMGIDNAARAISDRLRSTPCVVPEGTSAQVAEALRQLIFEETTQIYIGSICVGFEMSAVPSGIKLSYEAAETILRLLAAAPPAPAVHDGRSQPSPVTQETIDKIDVLYARTSGPWHANPARPPREVKLKRPHWEIGQPFGKGVGIIFGDDITQAKLIVELFNLWPFLRDAISPKPAEKEGWEPIGEVSEIGRDYLKRRIECMQEAIDKQTWHNEDGPADCPEYWKGRLHEAKIALSNLTQPLERRVDGFGRSEGDDR